MTTQKNEPFLACHLSAIPQEQRAAHEATVRRIFAATQEVRELSMGYALRLPNETTILQDMVTYISNERLCCPFFHFTLEIEPEQGPVWLSLTAAVDVKDFLVSEGFPLPQGFLRS